MTQETPFGRDMLPAAVVSGNARADLTRQWFTLRDEYVEGRTKKLVRLAAQASALNDTDYSTPEFCNMALGVVLELEEQAEKIALKEYYEQNLSLNDYLVTHHHG